MRHWNYLFFACALVASCHAALQISNVAISAASEQIYGVVEISFELSKNYTSKQRFDPQQVSVIATFTTPGNKNETVPGFFKQESSPSWSVRYSPRVLGKHSAIIYVKDFQNDVAASKSITFSSVSGSSRGFITTKPNDVRLYTTSGSQFVIKGINLATCSSGTRGNDPECSQSFSGLGAIGMNFVRVWANERWHAHAIERGPWTSYQEGVKITFAGIGQYSLDNAARGDAIFSNAFSNNVHVMWTLLSFGDFGTYTGPDSDSQTNAYMSWNGGPITNYKDFWTNADAIRHFQNFLTYQFARYGAFTSLGMVEFWNEFDQDDIFTADAASWHATMSDFWRKMDVYKRPTTTSYAWMDFPEFSDKPGWHTLPGLDVTNVHRYGDQNNGVTPATYIKDVMFNQKSTPANLRPTWISEWGMGDGDDKPSEDPLGFFCHDGVWTAFFFANAAGTNMLWIGEYVLEANTLQRQIYRAFTTSVTQQDEGLLTATMFMASAPLPSNSKLLYGGYFSQPYSLIFIQDSTALPNNQSPPINSGSSITVSNLAENVEYYVGFIDTMTGGSLSTSTIASSATGTLDLKIPDFKRAVLLKVSSTKPVPVTTLTMVTSSSLSLSSSVLLSSSSTSTRATGSTTGSMVTGTTSSSLLLSSSLLISSSSTSTRATGSTSGSTTGHPVKYLGCYIEYDTDRSVNAANMTDPAMTSQICGQFCVSKGNYPIAAIESGTKCYCGNKVPIHGVDSSGGCWMNCPGDQTEKCGGTWRESVYCTTSSCPTSSFRF